MNSYAILRILSQLFVSVSTFATKNRFMYDHSTRSSILFVYLEVHLEAYLSNLFDLSKLKEPCRDIISTNVSTNEIIVNVSVDEIWEIETFRWLKPWHKIT